MNLLNQFIRYVFLNVCGMIGLSCYILADTFFVSKGLGADGVIYPMCQTYLKVILLFAPMFMINNLMLCFVRNDGDPKLAMAAMLIGSLSNIVLDYIFIFSLHMGIFGAVLATGFAPVISMMILLRHIICGKNRFHLWRCSIRLSVLAEILSGGLPSLITELASGIVIIVFNLLILRLQGNIGVAAYGVIANLSLVLLSVYTGTKMSCYRALLCPDCGCTLFPVSLQDLISL